MKFVAVSLVFLFACQDSKKASPQAAPPPPAPVRSDACAAALKSFDQFVDTGDPNPDQRAQVKAAVLDRCITDNWGEPALACMRAAGNSHDVFKCWNEQLTKEQRDVASKALGSLKQ